MAALTLASQFARFTRVTRVRCHSQSHSLAPACSLAWSLHPIHHVDGDRGNNTPSNLVICQNKQYHYLLHHRQKAMDAGYPPSYRRCGYCKEYDAPSYLYIQERPKEGLRVHHRACHNKAEQARKAAKRRDVYHYAIKHGGVV